MTTPAVVSLTEGRGAGEAAPGAVAGGAAVAVTLIVTDAEPGAITRHHVMTRHGAVRQVWLHGTLLVDIALWRPSRVHRSTRAR